MRPAEYAQLLCDDLDLPHALFEGPIAAAIEAQLAGYNALEEFPVSQIEVEGSIVIEVRAVPMRIA